MINEAKNQIEKQYSCSIEKFNSEVSEYLSNFYKKEDIICKKFPPMLIYASKGEIQECIIVGANIYPSTNEKGLNGIGQIKNEINIFVSTNKSEIVEKLEEILKK